MNVDRKVGVGLAAGSLMTILAWISKQYAGVEVPADVALAGATVINFLLQWLVPNKEISE